MAGAGVVKGWPDTPKKPNMLTRLNPRENSIDRHAPVVCHQK
jgi:hypothetical protein